MEYTLIAVEGVGPVVFLFGLVVAIYLVFQYASRENVVAQEIRSDEGIAKERPEAIRCKASEVPNAPSVNEVKRAVDQLEDKASELNELIARAERAVDRLEPALDHAKPEEPRLVESDFDESELEEESLADLLAELDADSDLEQLPDDLLMNLAADIEAEEASEEADANNAANTQLEASAPTPEDVPQDEKDAGSSGELASALEALRELTEEARRFCEGDAMEIEAVSSNSSDEGPDDKAIETRFRTIYQFADDGLTPWAIARRVGAPVGKIELILGLRGAR